ncbi:MAG TPA: TetR family transcriptional regulator [Acidimicrobiales bacterium]|nr:TetR family transcriptional regulator [Acidimicrobiales bacterium]
MDRQRIVSVALEIAHEHGVKAVTMTSVAERLGVAMPALYYHVSSRDELLGLIGISLLHTEAPASAVLDDWRGWMTEFARALRQQALREPTLSVVPAVRAYSMNSIPMLEQAATVLLRAGFPTADALWNFGFLVSTVLSSVYREHCLALERAQGRTQLSTTRAAIKEVGSDAAPTMWKIMQRWEDKPDSSESDPDHRFERELVVLLDGFEVQLAKHKAQTD